MSIVRIVDRYFEEALVILLFSAILLIGMEQVFSRYILRSVHSWSEEMMRILFVALSLVSFSLCAKRRQHVKVEALHALLPSGLRRVLSFFAAAAFLAFILLVVKYSFDITRLQFESAQTTAAMGMPTWTYFALGPAIFLLMAFRVVQKELLPLLLGKNAPEGENLL